MLLVIGGAPLLTFQELPFVKSLIGGEISPFLTTGTTLNIKSLLTKERQILFIKFMLLELCFVYLFRFLSLVFDWGVNIQLTVNQIEFWQLFAFNKVQNGIGYFITLIWAPFAENFFILIIYIIIVRVGRNFFPYSLRKFRLMLFCIIVLFLFPYTHTSDILTYRFGNLVILAGFMLYIFIYVAKLPEGTTFTAYLSSVLVHFIHNAYFILVQIIVYYIWDFSPYSWGCGNCG